MAFSIWSGSQIGFAMCIHSKKIRVRLSGAGNDQKDHPKIDGTRGIPPQLNGGKAQKFSNVGGSKMKFHSTVRTIEIASECRTCATIGGV
jgi:hypothetical protein